MTKGTKILEGMKILSKWDMTFDVDFEVGVGHDQLWAGSNESSGKMSLGDKKKLEDFGWFIDEEYESWSIFV